MTPEELSPLEKEAEDFNRKLWAEYSDSMKSFHEEESRWNKRILDVIKSQLGQTALDYIIEIFKESEASGKMEIVHETTGEYQKEETNSFGGIWVDQWSVGDSGDSWNGFVYVKLKEGMYLKTFYSM